MMKEVRRREAKKEIAFTNTKFILWSAQDEMNSSEFKQSGFSLFRKFTDFYLFLIKSQSQLTQKNSERSS
jgi:hypothetical protein